MFRVEVDGRSDTIAARSPVDAAEQYALGDADGWSSGQYRGGQAVAVVTDPSGVESAYVLEGGAATFAAWYLPG